MTAEGHDVAELQVCPGFRDWEECLSLDVQRDVAESMLRSSGKAAVRQRLQNIRPGEEFLLESIRLEPRPW